MASVASHHHFPLARTLSSDSILSTSSFSSSAAKLVVQLIPASQAAGAFVKKQGLNSYLELTLPSNKTVSSILKHLNQKWCSVEASLCVRLQTSPCGSPYHSLDSVLSSSAQHASTTVQSIFDSLNLLPSSKCVLHYTIFDPTAPPPPTRVPSVKRARSSPPSEPKPKTSNQSKQSSRPLSTSSSSTTNLTTPHTAPKRKRASADASSPTNSNPNMPPSSLSSSSSAAAAAARSFSSRYPSPPRDIFSGGYGSGGTVGGSPNGAFVFDGDCDFQEAYNVYSALPHHGFSGEDSTQSHASGKDADVSAYLSYSGAAAVAQLQQARTLGSAGGSNVVMRRVAVDDSAANSRADSSFATRDATAPLNASFEHTEHAYHSSAPLAPSTRSSMPWFNTSPSPMRFGTAGLGSPVRFGAHVHSSPPLSFLPATRPSIVTTGGSALGNSQKSLPPFSLDYGGDSRGSLGGLNWQAESSMWGGSSAHAWDKQNGFGVCALDTNSRSQLL